jgi:hypothetical protein
MIDAIEIAATVLGLLGAFLLATHTSISRYGWLAFLFANFATIGFAIGIERYCLMSQQVGFMATRLLWLCRSGLLSFRKTADST